MNCVRMDGRAWLALVAALGAGVLPAAATGCDQTCESSCSDQYDDCLARSPPGASKADCGVEYQRCRDSCADSDEAREDEP